VASSHSPNLTIGLLRSYSDAALYNAGELLVEASLLRDHGHNARAYFLAVACVEEAGKALLAFDAQNRNLSDPAVCSKLKACMENHAQKINYALSIWALNSVDQRAAFKMVQNLIFDLKCGREPSMYVDLCTNPDRVQTPRGIVHASATRNCIKLATDLLAYAESHVRTKIPFQFTTAQDRLFTMKLRKLQDMGNTEDFWWYYISRMESGQQDFAGAVLGYERDHLKIGTPFRPAQ